MGGWAKGLVSNNISGRKTGGRNSTGMLRLVAEEEGQNVRGGGTGVGGGAP